MTVKLLLFLAIIVYRYDESLGRKVMLQRSCIGITARPDEDVENA